MKFCTGCGSQLVDEAVFCTHCGKPCGDVDRPYAEQSQASQPYAGQPYADESIAAAAPALAATAAPAAAVAATSTTAPEAAAPETPASVKEAISAAQEATSKAKKRKREARTKLVKQNLTKARHTWAPRVVAVCAVVLVLSLFLPWFTYSYYTSSLSLRLEVSMSVIDFFLQMGSLGLGGKAIVEVLGAIVSVIFVVVGIVMERRGHERATAVLIVSLFAAFFFTDMYAQEAGAAVIAIDNVNHLCLMDAGLGPAMVQLAAVVAIAAIIIDRLGIVEAVSIALNKINEEADDNWGFIRGTTKKD